MRANEINGLWVGDLGSSLYPTLWASYGYSHVGDNVMLVTYGWRQF